MAGIFEPWPFFPVYEFLFTCGIPPYAHLRFFFALCIAPTLNPWIIDTLQVLSRRFSPYCGLLLSGG